MSVGTKRSLQGVVVSAQKTPQTIVVAVERSVRHPLYNKVMRKTDKYMAHDANNECRIGDKVTISETKPISKRKAWALVTVDERAQD
ncbi:MAG: 30S ribosomal protein S17 [Thiotrichales bacterium 32-46-8]|jgi:small subunit ribosomal protein S17|nr:30S ribosomal protein S17 [Gammaproteobacteria bacterium]OYX05795.1 MAG: 30S ribosomal protein S17 [Thiotrichales bacterium 32-46-8]OYY24205.1 MAG: 30S ribosomal protein S17 [Thiotrichales bacterium 35-46-9]OYZ07604.1 MAG: 30S ribosomal protein S17 [Thiotrichales bacterium 16-46-22]OYZ42730.1 MAG: 30S ribosomal protein S17 [Thiotrichales bacterium 24-47-4]OZA20354.1 MAG: 30S ribosomal protein S17 [Thiotrichales bacterium 17-46-47]OZA97790.1 MAG: 30S ribosomal protein S17 [Thiotrichales bac